MNEPANQSASHHSTTATFAPGQRALLAKVARSLAASRPFTAGAPVVVAVSGGADSLCLLGALLALRASRQMIAALKANAAQTATTARASNVASDTAYPTDAVTKTDTPGELIVATFDHGLRGAASVDDARWVVEFAATLGLRCVTERGDTLAYARAQRLSQEDAARRLRYAFLRRTSSAVGASPILLGHTRDDQAETVALNWLHGAGLDGLAGMRPLEGDLVRPLLAVTHVETVAYCAARGWAPRDDPSNADLRFTRNRVRRQLLPLLSAFNPNLRQTLARNADLIAEDERYLDAHTDSAWRATVRDHPASAPSGAIIPGAAAAPATTVTFELAALQAQPLALQRRLLRRAALHALLIPGGDDATLANQRLGLAGRLVETNQPNQPLEARHIAVLERLLATGHTGDALDLPAGLRARRDYDALIIERRPPSPAATSAQSSPGVIPTAPPLVPGAISAAVSPPPLSRLREKAAQTAQPPASEGVWKLPIPGVLEIPALGWRLRAARITLPAGLEGDTIPGYAPIGDAAANTSALPPIPALAPIARAGTAAQLPRAELRVYVDADCAGAGPLLVRAWLPGDRFMPLGMDHEKKLQDYFADARVPRAYRARLPLVIGPAHILWVATQRIDQRARLTLATRHILALQCEPLA